MTRIPDRNNEAAPCIAEASAHPEKLEPVDPEDPSSPKAMWSGECTLGDQKIIKLTVRNDLLESKKRETVGKHTRKELEEGLKFCKLSTVQYDDVIGQDKRGHPRNGDNGRVKAVKVTADAAIPNELVERDLHQRHEAQVDDAGASRNLQAPERHRAQLEGPEGPPRPGVGVLPGEAKQDLRADVAAVPSAAGSSGN